MCVSRDVKQKSCVERGEVTDHARKSNPSIRNVCSACVVCYIPYYCPKRAHLWVLGGTPRVCVTPSPTAHAVPNLFYFHQEFRSGFFSEALRKLRNRIRGRFCSRKPVRPPSLGGLPPNASPPVPPGHGGVGGAAWSGVYKPLPPRAPALNVRPRAGSAPNPADGRCDRRGVCVNPSPVFPI